ncbi:MAG TPA: adenylate/guanylate cyclase domain-containing protein, partial [Xanthobacteraceae bacterium]|nr:adenylate/guanylate cyclase domain-containing protein [Xanthobacteraceae bacterium]
MAQEGAARGRRLAAIMVADVAGYSRLMHNDEETTHARLSAILTDTIEPAIAEHGGRIVKYTGDGFLAEFPSAVEAVRAAEHFQGNVRNLAAEEAEEKRIVFRVGINVGDVIVEASDIFGDGVNIAARLEGIAEPGGICISASAHDQVSGKIDVEFTDLGEHNLKNIARPIRAYAVKPYGPDLIRHGFAPRQPAAPRLSIVVLPFTNFGGNPEQDYFVDGITESLTTDLSRIPGSFVIARNTSFTFKNKPVDARLVGRDLGVRYVLEGSVQGSGDRIRVNAQLIDASTGAHLWAERFDKPRADIFDMQDEITTRLARIVGVELVAAESRRAEREPAASMDAVDLAMRGWAILNQPLSLRSHRAACDLFEDALRRDDRNVEALIGLATYHSDEIRIFASTNRGEQLRIAETAITKALSVAPRNASAHLVYGNVLHVSGATERSLREFEYAIALDHNLAWAHAQAGFAKVLLGRAEKAEADLLNAIRLSPRDPGLDRWHALLGISDLFLGRLGTALDRLGKSLEMNPNVAMVHFFFAAALGLSGRSDEASAARDAGLRIDSNFTVARFRNERRS